MTKPRTKNGTKNAEPDHRAVEAAVQKWWETHTERRSYSATWNPDAGIAQFQKKFDPTGELGDLGGVFSARADGGLIVRWANQLHILTPGMTWTYRPRRDRTMPLPAEPQES